MAKINKTVGNLPIKSGSDKDGASLRHAILLWGPSGCGKTTLAASAPGKKLWLSFGDNEHVSVMHRKDVVFVELFQHTHEELFKLSRGGKNPFGLDQVLSEDTDITTVVVDSITALAYLALLEAIYTAKAGASKKDGFVPSIEMPGLSAYGARNGLVLEVLTGILRVTSKHGVNVILTAHEADASMKVEGGREIIDYVSIMLGGQIVNNVTLRLSEIWYMMQTVSGEKDRIICVRPTRLRKPMKSRMFSQKGKPEFVIGYDAEKPDKGQMTLASLFEDWEKAGYTKIPVPGEKK